MPELGQANSRLRTAWFDPSVSGVTGCICFQHKRLGWKLHCHGVCSGSGPFNGPKLVGNRVGPIVCWPIWFLDARGATHVSSCGLCRLVMVDIPVASWWWWISPYRWSKQCPVFTYSFSYSFSDWMSTLTLVWACYFFLRACYFFFLRQGQVFFLCLQWPRRIFLLWRSAY